MNKNIKKAIRDSIVIMVVIVLILGAFASSIKNNYIYQGKTEIITQDAIKITIPWKVSYKYEYLNLYKTHPVFKSELKELVDNIIRENYHLQYSLIDFLNRHAKYGILSKKYNLLTQKEKDILKMIGINNISTSDLFIVNEDTQVINKIIGYYYNSNQIKNTKIEEEKTKYLKEKFLNQLKNGDYK